MRARSKLIRPAAWIALALGFAVFAQAWHGLGWSEERPLEVDKSLQPFGAAWILRLPRALRDPVVEHRARLFENDRELARSKNRQDVATLGLGRFVIRRGTLFFAADDGMDPRRPGRTYTIRFPKKLKPVWLGLAAALCAGGILGLRSSKPPARRPTGWDEFRFCASLFGIVLIARCVWLLLHRDFGDGFMMVGGLPYSDALGWSEAAWQLSQGWGLRDSMGDQRPLYAILLGWVYTFTGISLLWVKIWNALCGAVAAVAAGWISTRIAGLMTGIVAGIYFGVAGLQMGLLPVPMTESSGHAFVGLALVFAVAAFDSGRAAPLAASGLFFALANLCSVFTLLGSPLVIMVMAAGIWRRFGFRAARRAALAGILVFALVLAPWVARQWRTFGVVTISPNSAEMLYATASPAGRLDESVFAEADAAGVVPEPGARYRFFQGRFVAAVADDPVGYLRRLGRGLEEFFSFFRPELPLPRLLATLFPLLLAARAASRGAGRAGRLLLAGGALAAGAWAAALLPGSIFAPAILVSGAVAARGERRWLAAACLALVAGAAVMETVTSGVVTGRVWAGLEWIVLACELTIIVRLHRLLSGATRSPAAAAPRRAAARGAGHFFIPTGAALVSLVLLASLVVAIRAVYPASRQAVAPAQGTDDFQRRISDSVPPPPSPLWSGIVRITPYQCVIPAGSNVHHWARSFGIRDQPRTAAYVRSLESHRLVPVQFGGRTERLPHQTATLVGVLNVDQRATLGHDIRIIEALGLLPVQIDRQGVARHPAEATPEFFPLTREAGRGNPAIRPEP